ncbi:MAG: S24 family peptidase [Chloroflexota bacterium]|nr:S24 family peptidase [Chloroflexota bacterium]
MIDDSKEMEYSLGREDGLGAIELSVRPIPLYAQKVSAAPGIMAGEVKPIGEVYITRDKREPLLAVRMEISHLQPDIENGDIIIVNLDRPPEDGDFVLCSRKDVADVKCFRQDDFNIWVESNDRKISLQGLVIHGVVIEVHKRFG